MIREGKIGFAEGFALLFLSNLARIFLADPAIAIEVGKNMAWALYAIGTVVSLFEFWIIASLMRRHQNVTIVEASEQILGPYLGLLCNLVFAAFFIYEESILMRRYSEAILTAALPDTPISLVLMMPLITGIVACFYGLETIARVARVSVTFVVLGLVILFVSVTRFVDVTNIYPLWSMDAKTILIESVMKYSLVSEGLLAAVIVQTFGGWQYFWRSGITALSLGGVIKLIVALLILLTFGVHVASEELLPFFNLSRLVTFGRFFQRIESVFLLTWAMVGFIKLAVTFYAAVVILARVFRLPDFRPLLWIVSLLCFIVSILPPDLPTAVKLDVARLRTWTLMPTVLLPLLLLVLSKVRKVGEQPEDGT